MIAEIKTKLKYVLLKGTKKYAHLKPKVKCKHTWYGHAYGGFYVCPEYLNKQSIVYSFGIGEDTSFDNAIMSKHDCKVFGFDPTPKSINWVKNNEEHDKFCFYEYGLSNESGFVDFYLPKNPDHVSGSSISQENIDVSNKISVEMKSLTDIMDELGHKHIDLLKMDIEGSEYGVIDDILNSKISITQILIEFHDRFVEDGNNKSKQAIEKLSSHGFEVFATSDSFEEISFINKSALQ